VGQLRLITLPFQTNNGTPETGEVYVFDFGGTSWNQSARIVDNDVLGPRGFGFSVDL